MTCQKNNDCPCHCINDDGSTDAQTANVNQVPQLNSKINSKDTFLVIRNNNLFRANFNDLSAELALSILEKAVQTMPKTNPGDGVSLWLDNGTIRMASGDPADLGTMSPNAFMQSFNNCTGILPTSSPPKGGFWLDHGVLVYNPPQKNNGCE